MCYARCSICTIQRLYSILRGEELAEDADELSGAELAAALGATQSREVVYNPSVPIEKFDFIVTDECHRSIYNLWRQVLEYFDGFLIGLTATPAPQTIAYFNQNRVAEYNHERAVADGVNVGYDVYRIRTKVTERGGKVEKGYLVDRRSRATRAARQEALADDMDYTPADLDRSVVNPDQIRTILATYRDVVFTELFPDRTLLPKTLIFAKDDCHAEDVVHTDSRPRPRLHTRRISAHAEATMTRVARFVVPPHANEATHARVMRRLSKATSKELVQSLVSAKIIGANGKLTAPYRSERTRNGSAKRKYTRAAGT